VNADLMIVGQGRHAVLQHQQRPRGRAQPDERNVASAAWLHRH
jgi:hypothetical protein